MRHSKFELFRECSVPPTQSSEQCSQSTMPIQERLGACRMQAEKAHLRNRYNMIISKLRLFSIVLSVLELAPVVSCKYATVTHSQNDTMYLLFMLIANFLQFAVISTSVSECECSPMVAHGTACSGALCLSTTHTVPSAACVKVGSHFVVTSNQIIFEKLLNLYEKRALHFYQLSLT